MNMKDINKFLDDLNKMTDGIKIAYIRSYKL